MNSIPLQIFILGKKQGELVQPADFYGGIKPQQVELTGC